MENTPKFIREFSKKNSPEERKQTAQKIKDRRTEYFEEKQKRLEEQNELEQSINERETMLARQLESINELKNEIEKISASKLKELLNYFRLKNIRSDIALNQIKYDSLKRQQNRDISRKEKNEKKSDSQETPPELQEARRMLNNFYEDQTEKWARSNYTKEDIVNNFSEKNLASLNLNEYAILMRRFPCEMVAHVTRQGIRDHIGHMYHTAGEGAYANGFMKIAQDGRLRSPLGVYLVEKEKKQAIAKFLGLEDFKTEDEALRYLRSIADKKGGPGSYSDKMAIHFATEEVADSCYGSEKGNEIFIAYPSAYIASQYYFCGQLNKADGGYHNDQWVWANEEKGMDLNAGIVFIPKEAQVDKKTGSRYELDENMNPVENTEFYDIFKRVVDADDFYDFAEQAMKILAYINFDIKNQDHLRMIKPLCQKLEKDFDIKDKRLQMSLLNYQTLFTLFYNKKSLEDKKDASFELIESKIESALKENGLLYIEAKDTTTSKEFWEIYFAKNPKQKPSKIVYYEGDDPTLALSEWKNKQKINKKSADRAVGFSEKIIDPAMPQALMGFDRFESIARDVIKEYFSHNQKTPENSGVSSV